MKVHEIALAYRLTHAITLINSQLTGSTSHIYLHKGKVQKTVVKRRAKFRVLG